MKQIYSKTGFQSHKMLKNFIQSFTFFGSGLVACDLLK